MECIIFEFRCSRSQQQLLSQRGSRQKTNHKRQVTTVSVTLPDAATTTAEVPMENLVAEAVVEPTEVTDHTIQLEVAAIIEETTIFRAITLSKLIKMAKMPKLRPMPFTTRDPQTIEEGTKAKDSTPLREVTIVAEDNREVAVEEAVATTRATIGNQLLPTMERHKM